MGVTAEIINNGIDLEKFRLSNIPPIRNRVLCLPRKNKEDIDQIRSLIKTKEVEFIYADALTEEQLILEYQKADIFLATGYPEGFGLPPLEAMRCGCTVVGFTGGGASEYMIDGETALVAQDGDTLTAANQLDRLLQSDSLKESIRTAGMKIASRYSLENTKKTLHKAILKIENL